MNFTKMTPSDIPQVAKLYNELAYFIQTETRDDYFNFDILSEDEIADILRASLVRADSITYIVTENQRVIAFIAGEIRACFLPFSQVKQVGYISGAYVIPEYRRQGVIKQLEQMLLDFFNEHGLTYVELNVLTNNHPGKISWEALGYQTFREQMRKKIKHERKVIRRRLWRFT